MGKTPAEIRDTASGIAARGNVTHSSSSDNVASDSIGVLNEDISRIQSATKDHSESLTYKKGDFVVESNLLYFAKDEINPAKAFEIADWELVGSAGATIWERNGTDIEPVEKDDNVKVRTLQVTASQSFFDGSTQEHGAVPQSHGWDVQTSVHKLSTNLGFPTPVILGLHFKPDGTKLFWLQGKILRSGDVPKPWDITVVNNFQSEDLDVNGNIETPSDMFWTSDGQTLFVIDHGPQPSEVRKWTILLSSDAFDINKIVLATDDKYELTNINTAEGIYFRPDGLRMYIVNSNLATDDVTEFELSVPFNLAATILPQTPFELADLIPLGIFFRSDGKRMYIVGQDKRNILEYELHVGWHIDVHTDLVNTFSYAPFIQSGSQITGIVFQPDGSKMFLTGKKEGVLEFDLGLSAVGKIGINTPYPTHGLDSRESISAQGSKSHPITGTVNVVPDGEVLTMDNIVPGSNYLNGETVFLEAPPGTKGKGGKATITTNPTTIIETLSDIDGLNANYDNGEAITLVTATGSGSGATITADVVDLAIENLVLTGGGSNYAIGDKLDLLGGTSTVSSAFVLVASLEDSGEIQSITVVNNDGGRDYVLTNVINLAPVSGPGTGGTAQVATIETLGVKLESADSLISTIFTRQMHVGDKVLAASEIKTVIVEILSDTELIVADRQSTINNPHSITEFPAIVTFFEKRQLFGVTGTGNPVIDGGLPGPITAINIGNAGSGYDAENPPNAVISEGGGAATVDVVVGTISPNIGKIIDYINIVNTDVFETQPILTVEAPPDPPNAPLSAVIDDEGEMGIGKADPRQKLHVAGSIKTEELVEFGDGSTQIVGSPTQDYSWHIETAIYRNTFQAGVTVPDSKGLFFSPTGLKMYTCYDAGTSSKAREFNLSEPYNVLTAVAGTIYSLKNQGTTLTPEDIFWKGDGSEFYVLYSNSVGDAKIEKYFSIKPFELAEAIYANTDILLLDDSLRTSNGIFYKPDGKMLYLSNTDGRIYGFTTRIPFDVNLPETPSFSFKIPTTNSIRGLFFRDDGRKLYVIAVSGFRILEFMLETAWLPGDDTILEHEFSYNELSEVGNPNGIFFSSTGSKLFLKDTGAANNEFSELDLGLVVNGIIPNISIGDKLEYFDKTTQQTATTPTDIDFHPSTGKLNQEKELTGKVNVRALHMSRDGTKVMFMGAESAFPLIYNVYNGTLGKPFDISTLSVSANEFTPALVTNTQIPVGLYFSKTGKKMYVTSTDTISNVGFVIEYDLTSSYDVVSAVKVETLILDEVIIKEPTGIFFTPDGKRMFILDADQDQVSIFNLVVPFNIKNAINLSRKTIDDTNALGLFFREDGNRMYLCGNGNDEIQEYSFAAHPWNFPTGVSLLELPTELPYDSFKAGTYNGISISPDGSKLYVIGTDNKIQELDLGIIVGGKTTTKSLEVTDGIDALKINQSIEFVDNTTQKTASTPSSLEWNIETLKNNNVEFEPLPADTTEIEDIFFKPDGTKMYLLSNVPNNEILEYTLTKPWDITTTMATVVKFVITADIPDAFFIRHDGRKLYLVYVNLAVKEFDILTPWDISTAVITNHNSTVLSGPFGITFKPDGTRMFIARFGQFVTEYSLTRAWDVSTIVFTRTINVGFNLVTGITFKPDGTRMYLTDASGDNIKAYKLVEPWSLINDTAILASASTFSVITMDSSIDGIYIKPTGEKLFFVGNTNKKVFELDMGIVVKGKTLLQDVEVSDNFEVDTIKIDNHIEYPDGSTQSIASPGNYILGDASTMKFKADGTAIGLTAHFVFFKTDGTRFFEFIYSGSSNRLESRNMAVPWDVSALTLGPESIIIAEQFLDIYITPDGKQLFTITTTPNIRVIQYAMNTAWDPSTLTNVKNIDISGTHQNPKGIWLSPDGTKLFILSDGATGSSDDNSIAEIPLAIPFDIGTGTFSNTTLLPLPETPLFRTGLAFSPDGKKFYVTSGANNTIDTYTLQKPWSLISANFTKILSSFKVLDSVSGRDESQGVFISPNLEYFFSLLKRTSDDEFETTQFDMGLNSPGGVKVGGRLLTTRPVANVNAANPLVLPDIGNYFAIQGNTPISYISILGWTVGSVVTFNIIDGFLIVDNAISPPTNTFAISLAGDVDFLTKVSNTITFVLDDNRWNEIARTASRTSIQNAVKTADQIISESLFDTEITELSLTLPNKPGGHAIVNLFLLCNPSANNQGMRFLFNVIGKRATATIDVQSGAVDSFTVVDRGSGYLTPPTVVITQDGGGTQATATAVLGTGGAPDNIPIDQLLRIDVDVGGTGITTATAILTGGGVVAQRIVNIGDNSESNSPVVFAFPISLDGEKFITILAFPTSGQFGVQGGPTTGDINQNASVLSSLEIS